MQKLTSREEEIMQIFWQRGPSFVKEVIEDFPEPKPHYNTVSTLIRILETKAFLAHKAFGNTHQYYALISKEAYQAVAVEDFVKRFFNNSIPEMVTSFAKKEKISPEELNQILKEIKKDKS